MVWGMVLKNLDHARTQIFASRSDGFLKAAEDIAALATGIEYDSAVALLAVHSAIALSDAIHVALQGKKKITDNHEQAAPSLKRLCGLHSVNQSGILHFRWLLKSKNEIAYGDRRFIDTAAALDRAQKFSSWAYSNLKEVLRGQESA